MIFVSSNGIVIGTINFRKLISLIIDNLVECQKITHSVKNI